MIPVEQYVALSAVLFVIGGMGFLIRRNVLVTLLSIEVMLNAANLALVAFNRSRFAHVEGTMYPGASHILSEVGNELNELVSDWLIQKI